ncbi:MAG: ferritin family protein [Candidatus Thiodiazotropha sp. (ex Monitilora ramsayi)]|nr:ferritin family protein [Candidatus Thiodiazotropha sp. (ex Monitilora ramsayi)]
MSKDDIVRIESVEEFLVHAMELEEASYEHYDELADTMEVHNNLQVAELFRKLANYSRLHAEEVHQRAANLDLPKITPWDFKWKCPSTPEAFCMDEADYMMSSAKAMEIALFNEIRGRDFYQQVADNSPSEAVKKLALEMVEEENWHVEMLREWQASMQDEQPQEDLDPPNMPE